MKNVFLYISVLILLGVKGYGQNMQNANWCFGRNSGLTFSPNINTPTVLTGVAMNTIEGCASVSNPQGNLLFYTDGSSVWNANHQITVTGLNGHTSSTQSAIIIPKPNNSDRFFIVTIDGYTGDYKGLYYSEVNSIGQIIPNQKNIVLRDHNNSNINGAYQNASEKLTSTRHSNGVDYWLVTQIRDRVYSYKVTSSGISLTPQANTVAPVNIQAPSSNVPGNGLGEMKISPDAGLIGIIYGRIANLGGRLVYGTFDNSTGQVQFNNNYIVGPGNFYSLAFSPNSRVLYFGTNTGSPPAISQISRIDLSTGNIESTPLNYSTGLQLAINGKIYISDLDSSVSPRPSNLSVINSPDNFYNPDIESHIIFLGYNALFYGMPQLVPFNDNYVCTSDLTLVSPSDDVSFGLGIKQASVSIKASNVIYNESVAVYHAGTTVVLKPGFHAVNGSKFRGYIEGCSGTFLGRQSNNEEENSSEAIHEESIFSDTNFFSLFPNPATAAFMVTSTLDIKHITVTSFDGKTVFNGDMKEKTTSHTIDIGGYIPGFYIVNVTTQTGETQTQKLIKN